MSAPAMKVRPAPVSTIASTLLVVARGLDAILEHAARTSWLAAH